VSPLDVVVVNYNTCRELDACLSALAEAGQVVVVDNASTDGSLEMVRRQHPHVILRANRQNVGYGAAVNQGIRSCSAEHVLVLNSDTRVLPGTLAALGAYLDQHPRVAVVGPRLITPEGRLQPSCYAFPTLLPTLLQESTIGQLLRYAPWLREVYPPTASHTRPRRVAWVEGAAMAIRRAAFDAVGGFDPSFFMYYEEVDLCYRLATAGWEVHFAPVGTVVHVGGASTRRHRSDMAVQALASQLWFYQRHYSRPRMVALVVLIQGVVLARWLLAPIRIRLTHDANRRSQLREDAMAWRRVLRGEWLRLEAGGRPR
jgi:GT2 family glycosyltransferase